MASPSAGPELACSTCSTSMPLSKCAAACVPTHGCTLSMKPARRPTRISTPSGRCWAATTTRGHVDSVCRPNTGEPTGEDRHTESTWPRVVVAAQHRPDGVEIRVGRLAGFIERVQPFVGTQAAAHLLSGIDVLQVLQASSGPADGLAIVEDP